MESTNQSLQRKNVGGKTERLEKLDEEVSGKQSALGQWQRASKNGNATEMISKKISRAWKSSKNFLSSFEELVETSRMIYKTPDSFKIFRQKK